MTEFEFEFRLLGPLEVWRAGAQVAVRGPKLRSLLAMLLLHAGEAVSTDRLIDALWGEQPPAAAANALQARVASLRRTLGADAQDVLETRSPGYLLRVNEDAVDIACFERRVANARAIGADDPAAAARLLREALVLWRGPALADFAFEPFANAEAARLEELRLAALADRLDADLALGRHQDLVPELEALLVEHRLRERFAAQLMLALYRGDRQADASRVYHATRAALVEELGLEPGAPLRELHQRVLDHDPSLASVAQIIPIGGGIDGDRSRRPAHNLPVELTSFIGRERELEEIAKLLPTARLVALTGAGGSGKTRLALRVAQAALDDYPDGVWLVELAALADPALVAKSVAVTLGVRQEVEPLIAALANRVGKARLLIVLDNCEHVVGACAELAHGLLRACPNLRILATSREPLKVSGEVIWPVPGLAVPDSDRTAPPDEYAAIRLFAERAAAVKPGFTLDTRTTPAVVELCERLDGMPLAIELAAARVQTLTPHEALGRLDDRFRLLTRGRRDALARQQTLRATVDWSHDLLARPERSLLRRLSVFAGGWLLADAEHVCADDDLPSDEVLDVLEALVAKSLVVAEAGSGDATRYRLLETLRQYARERLRDAGEEHSVRARHFCHFLELSEDAREQNVSGTDAQIAALTGQLENLRESLAFAHDADAPGLMRLATAMEHLWLAGNLTEGRRWLEEALAATTEPTLGRGRALHVAVIVASLQQDHASAREFGNEYLALSASLGDGRGEAWARQSLGFIEWEAGHHNAAVGHLKRSLAMHKARGERLGTCRSLIFLATAKTYIPASKREGRAQLQQGLDSAREIGDAWGEGWAEAFLGFADIDAGEPELAARRFRRVATATTLGPIRAAGLDGLATLAVDDEPLRTIRLLGAATAHRQRHGGSPVPHFGRMTERIRVRAERQVEPETAEQAWDEGFQMSTNTAVAYALAHQPASTAPSPS